MMKTQSIKNDENAVKRIAEFRTFAESYQKHWACIVELHDKLSSLLRATPFTPTALEAAIPSDKNDWSLDTVKAYIKVLQNIIKLFGENLKTFKPANLQTSKPPSTLQTSKPTTNNSSNVKRDLTRNIHLKPSTRELEQLLMKQYLAAFQRAVGSGLIRKNFANSKFFTTEGMKAVLQDRQFYKFLENVVKPHPYVFHGKPLRPRPPRPNNANPEHFFPRKTRYSNLFKDAVGSRNNTSNKTAQGRSNKGNIRAISSQTRSGALVPKNVPHRAQGVSLNPYYVPQTQVAIRNAPGVSSNPYYASQTRLATVGRRARPASSSETPSSSGTPLLLLAAALAARLSRKKTAKKSKK